jgi:hypothetical protein
MVIKGRRRGGAGDLNKHLQRTDENESVAVRKLEGFSFEDLTGANLEKAIRQMEAIGYGKGAKRNFFHTILAPAYGETLTVKQRDFSVDYYIEKMGFKGHQYALVEHWKKGKQHFHLVVNIIHPETGKIHELKWTKRKEWQISRDLEQILGLKTYQPIGKAAKTWQMQRGKRTGIDPRKMRKEITAIYHASKTKEEFVAALDKAGFVLTHGRRNQLVLVDKSGDTHGLMRMIEGKKLADLRRKFPGIGKMQLASHAELIKARKPETAYSPRRRRKFINPQHVRLHARNAYRGSRNGRAFIGALNKKGYALGRGTKGYAVIDHNGDRYDLNYLVGRQAAKGLNKTFPDLAATGLRPASEIMRSVKARYRIASRRRGSTGSSSYATNTGLPIPLLRKSPYVAKEQPQQEQQPAPVRPAQNTKGWPLAALMEWAAWGHKDPEAFFYRWPELRTGNPSPGGMY